MSGMEIYIQKMGLETPLDADQVLLLLEDGQVSAGDLACVRGSQGWRPLGTLPEAPLLAREVFKLELALKQVATSLKIWERYKDNLLLRKKLEEDVDGWGEALLDFNDKFPNHPFGVGGLVWLYFYQAVLKIKSNAFMAFDSDDPITGYVILAQKENAEEAVTLLDKAIELSDEPKFHLMKLEPLIYLERFEDVVAAANHVLNSFADDESACREALRQRQLIERMFN